MRVFAGLGLALVAAAAIAGDDQPINQTMSLVNDAARIRVEVTTDRQSLAGFDQDGKQIWTVQADDLVVDEVLGSSRIRHVQFESDRDYVQVVIGKHTFARVNIRTGEYQHLGSD